ncbi:MAG: X-Pro aminopeptidase [Novosphingobium sp. 28-62-57]|uniref:aminopeptidase P family protein n=1 Tax=Novosphingobium sp. 28-62-57 TaxID=1970409 RepID=UPI000BDA9D0E|nr:aminopeptidase P family protein [Novosphingobium sp. 28-62-57]OYW50683.1 MAG: X-Pro aminopeptidase [Novosphingobium sp. 12-62-10]OYZ11788.1 MAG: X-Pro aminopeptidase [Novosphingobium sp. 28-62-57]OZA32869.1 MAG: X-Pro aminopeptidase [Novosphingobium sp. 17-62-9]HQS71225.1 aminopeptidase P family protein [Novosphingobium sp.]
MQTHEARLDALRKQLAADGLDGFVIPISDEHMSEYVGAYAQRLEWLTGFGGSAGTAVVLADKAAIFVDGRYTLQVRDQVDGRLWSYESVPQTSVAAWLGEHAPQGARIGYDAWLHAKGWADGVAQALSARAASLVPVATNPVDAVWDDQPAPSLAPAVPHADEHAGKSAHEKRAEVAEWLGARGLDAAVISALDSVAWLLNIRGADVDRTPVALSFVLAHADGTADLFIAPEKVTPELAAHLGNAVRVQPREAFVPALQALQGRKVAVDPERAVAAIFHALEGAGAQVVAVTDPVVLPKAIKNPVEQAGHRAAQARDGAAIARFLRWIAVEAPQGAVTELSAADRLQAFRADTSLLRDLSFDTISGSGPNGAVVHYRVSEETSRTLEPNSVYLVDSGGQYLDGTTDITRTVWIGPDAPPLEVKDRFTRVLKGHIALARAVFPKGTAGSQLDSFARQFLWAAGLDYAHGTGHGVGSFLSVHEGPQRIAKAAGGQAGTGQELLPGMILSNEPGYYKAGAYGIRIENLVLVERREMAGAEGEFFGFETLTFAPIARDLVDVALLSAEELDWLNAYHARVRAVLAPQLDGDDLAWLEAACAPL